jgi:hypothetical protein
MGKMNDGETELGQRLNAIECIRADGAIGQARKSERRNERRKKT